MTTTPDSLRRDLANGSAAAARADASTEEIRKAAAERLTVVDRRLADLRPRAVADESAADEYQALVRERGELNLTLGASRG